MVQIIMMVCKLAQPDICEEQHIHFAWQGSLARCAMAAQMYIAQWAGEHPQWEVKSFHCENPGARDKAEADKL
jgi:hypothetical protein